MKHWLLILFAFFCKSSYTQVQFEDLTLSQALRKASGTGKIVFVHYVSQECEQCNEVADKAFDDKELGKALKQKCISIKMKLDNEDRQSFIAKYNSTEAIGSFFIRSDGDLLYRTTSTTTLGSTYINHLNIAWEKQSEGRLALKQLDEMWTADKSIAAMEENLKRRNELMLPLDSLLDVYALSLPQDSLTSFRTLQFIARMAPMLKSEANNLLRKDGDMFNQAWYRMDLKERVNINARIIEKTIAKAIKLKDLKLATQTANFSYNIYNDIGNPVIKRKKYDRVWMHYYLETKDTMNYCRVVMHVFDNYVMKVSVDSLKQVDSLVDLKALQLAKKDTSYETGKRVIKTVYSKNVAAQRQSNDLYLTAKDLYKVSKIPLHKEKALVYAKRALQFYESPEALDTYARITYNFGNKQDAIAAEEKAIAIMTDRELKVERYVTALRQMQNNEAVTF